ncbi:hypothetical protein ACFL2M_00235 [Patescibacteria group bacterium]
MSPQTKVATKTKVGTGVAIGVIVVAGIGLLGYAAGLFGIRQPVTDETQPTALPKKWAPVAYAEQQLGERFISQGEVCDMFECSTGSIDMPETINGITIADIDYARTNGEYLVYWLDKDKDGNALTVDSIYNTLMPKLTSKHKAPLEKSKPDPKKPRRKKPLIRQAEWAFVGVDIYKDSLLTDSNEGEYYFGDQYERLLVIDGLNAYKTEQFEWQTYYYFSSVVYIAIEEQISPDFFVLTQTEDEETSRKDVLKVKFSDEGFVTESQDADEGSADAGFLPFRFDP